MKAHSRFVFAAALAAGSIAACVGDSPAGDVGALSDSGSDATARPDALTSGGSGANGSSGGASSSTGDLDAAFVPPAGTALWGAHFDVGENVARNRPAADAWGAKRVVARSLEIGADNLSKKVQLDWYDDDQVARTKVFTSGGPLEVTGVRLDADGNAYLSLQFQERIESVGEQDVAAEAPDGGQLAGSKCAVYRLDGATGSAVWSRTFASRPGGFLELVAASCKVARAWTLGQPADRRVLVSGSFTGNAMFSPPGLTPIANAPNHLSDSPRTDGFVSVLDMITGELRAVHSFGAAGDSNMVVRDATFASASSIMAVGETSSSTITLGATGAILATAPLRSQTGDGAATILRVDLLDPAASTGESWYAPEPAGATPPFLAVAAATAIVGTGDQAVVVGEAKANQDGASLRIVGVPTDYPLGAAGRRFAVGIGPGSARRVFGHELSATGTQSVTQIADGRVLLATTSGVGVDFGASCTLPATSGVGTTLAFFSDASLATCTHAVAFANAIPIALTGSSATAVLTGTTAEAVDFGDHQVPKGPVPQGFAVEFAP